MRKRSSSQRAVTSPRLTLADPRPTQLDLLEARLEIAAPFDVREVTVLRQDGRTFWNAVKAAQAKAWHEGSRAQPPSNKQIWKLYSITGARTFSDLEQYVRFANGYKPQCERLTRVHWVYAIELAMRGRNVYGTTDDLLRLSFGDV